VDDRFRAGLLEEMEELAAGFFAAEIEADVLGYRGFGGNEVDGGDGVGGKKREQPTAKIAGCSGNDDGGFRVGHASCRSSSCKAFEEAD